MGMRLAFFKFKKPQEGRKKRPPTPNERESEIREGEP